MVESSTLFEFGRSCSDACTKPLSEDRELADNLLSEKHQ
jgi:hypothetical protein